MPSKSLERPLAALRFAHDMTMTLLKDFPEDKACHLPSGTDNHLVWSIGHMAATYTWLLSQLKQTGKTPEHYATMFGGGSKPNPNPKDCPPLAEVRTHFEQEYERFIKAVEALPDAELTKPLNVGKFAKDTIELVDRAAWHEGWHAGQISSLRRALGLKAVMM